MFNSIKNSEIRNRLKIMGKFVEDNSRLFWLWSICNSKNINIDHT